ncbi:hypothetical protein J7T55_009303 [Diaporthe amygdali]|uniref:uncharacterized protein n=1 Tax=Phomopsis amygdali TaxID=1214568 RepID=UPI0022FE34CA|nr:uncharacterized protein J7T55_009303 [Diaporthe amygdali]KAJ0118520.1 hypothetical protein J7T55_009303 [Diaporthe amygdali]
MERDSRRDRRQWRGCHVFKDVIYDGDRPGSSRRNGGLKMGQPYYYYYELDCSVETHDPSLPSTSTCPYLPGQTVNMMWVPAEKSDRKRSASLSSVRREDFKTMSPQDKYSTPRPAPAAPELLNPAYRPTTSQVPIRTLKHKRSDRSISPTPSWWSPRKLFTRKNSVSSQASSDRHSDDASVTGSSCGDEQRRSVGSSASEGSRTRAMSPDSLRRFLSDDTAVVTPPADDAERLFLSIPDDIAEEDDDNFATSAASETGPKTILSPPPPVTRNYSADTLRRLPENASVVTLTATKPPTAVSRPLQVQFDDEQDTPTSRFSFSSDEGSIYDDGDTDASSPETENDTEIPSFYHSEAEDDETDSDILSPPSTLQPSKSGLKMGRESLEQSLANAFQGYHLPRTSMDGTSKAPVSVVASPPLLAAPVSSVVDDFMSEMNNFQSKWI